MTGPEDNPKEEREPTEEEWDQFVASWNAKDQRADAEHQDDKQKREERETI